MDKNKKKQTFFSEFIHQLSTVMEAEEMKTEARTLNTSHHQTQPHQHQIRSAPIEIRIPQYRAVYSQNGDKYLLNNIPNQGNYVIATLGRYNAWVDGKLIICVGENINYQPAYAIRSTQTSRTDKGTANDHINQVVKRSSSRKNVNQILRRQILSRIMSGSAGNSWSRL